jgi:hypothetical protein
VHGHHTRAPPSVDGSDTALPLPPPPTASAGEKKEEGNTIDGAVQAAACEDGHGPVPASAEKSKSNGVANGAAANEALSDTHRSHSSEIAAGGTRASEVDDVAVSLPVRCPTLSLMS